MTNWIDAQKALAKADPVLAALMKEVGPCTLKGNKRQPYVALLEAVAHQQLHGKAAMTIYNRFLALFGGKEPEPEALLAIEDAALRACGFSANKVLALKDIAAKAQDGTIPTRKQAARMSDDDLIKQIKTVRGVGRWTVEMLLMFTLARPDVLPVDDFGVREGFKTLYHKRRQPTPKELAKFAARWSPWRSVASWYMWRALELSRDRG